MQIPPVEWWSSGDAQAEHEPLGRARLSCSLNPRAEVGIVIVCHQESDDIGVIQAAGPQQVKQLRQEAVRRNDHVLSF